MVIAIKVEVDDSSYNTNSDCDRNADNSPKVNEKKDDADIE